MVHCCLSLPLIHSFSQGEFHHCYNITFFILLYTLARSINVSTCFCLFFLHASCLSCRVSLLLFTCNNLQLHDRPVSDVNLFLLFFLFFLLLFLQSPYLLILRTNDSSAKRGLDLGLSRGNAGSLQAKQLVGLTAANLPNGPGRRRKRSIFSSNVPSHV